MMLYLNLQGWTFDKGCLAQTYIVLLRMWVTERRLACLYQVCVC